MDENDDLDDIFPRRRRAPPRLMQRRGRDEAIRGRGYGRGQADRGGGRGGGRGAWFGAEVVFGERVEHGGNQYFRGRRGRGGGRGRGNHARHHEMNLRQLSELQKSDPSTIVMTLGLDSGLGPLLNQTSIQSQMVYLVARVLAEACKCTSAQEILIQILLTVEDSKFHEHVMKTLLEASYTPRDNEREKRQFIKDILTFLRELAVRLPHFYMATHTLGLDNYVDMMIKQLELRSDIVDEELLDKRKELHDMKVTLLDKVKQPKAARDVPLRPPPCDFRDIPIFPNVDDIHQDEKPFLRKNLAVGGYRDLEQYLDIQFRLLREDFVCPLREGIAEYMEAQVPGHGTQKLKDIRVYHDVHAIRTVCSDGGLLHRLTFDVSKLGRVRWENSKRLIFGSLVCLSHDNFQTLLFATVSDRDITRLRDGIIDVLFENGDDEEDILSIETEFVMVETSAYFEAYRHVLKSLQTLHRGDLPFEKYIVACVNEVEPSEYLKRKQTSIYDLRPMVDEDMILREDHALRSMLRLQGREFNYSWSRESMCARGVEILDHRDWPSADQLHLDASQYRAVKTALTKEFVIIQGPPGTGKTYVGLKIVKALLHNAKMWSGNNASPMLIVCYTNHALDQFLEGVVSYFKGSVIRVGGRMKSEILEDCSMKVQRQAARKRDSTRDMRITGRMRWQIREEMMALKLDIERSGLQIEAAEREVLHEDTLQPFMEYHYNVMMTTMNFMLLTMEAEGYGQALKPRSVMVEWLGIGNIEDIMHGMEQDAAEEMLEDDEDGEIDVQGEADIIQEQRIFDDKDEELEGGLDHLQRKIDNLQYQKEGYIAFDVTNLDRRPDRGRRNALQFQLPPKARKQLKRRLVKRLRSSEKMPAVDVARVQDPWDLQMDDRWKLYRHWVFCFTEKMRTDIGTKENRFRTAVAKYKESMMVEDKQILERATVIGMTTTCAARYQQVLREIGPKIIVVEEAAEVLEGHIITTLSKKCEHLILIGDHKQLKPNPTVYKLAKNYNLDLSLFERMVNNGVHCDTLELQHRMKPEISRLMKPIYPTLQDHPSVLNLENVKGISGNLFFLNHGYPEEGDAENRSHSNQFEAMYIVALCGYLLKQGYQRTRITVLTTYSGQLFKLKKLMPKQNFQGVKLTVVDNYQGEENDIILLSLVRSNPEGKVGFLKIENRVCVALSRAKCGLFVIGNFDMLAQESQLWKELIKDLKKNDMIGTSIKLYCQNHPNDHGISAKDAADFKKAPEGGCMKQCSFRLDCGHVCSRLCHPYDPQHEEYTCHKPCPKSICKNNHPCPRLCYQTCEKCQVPVETILPLCGHKQMVPCSTNTSKFSCMHACEKLLKCGHICGNPCGMAHQCTEPVKKSWRCGHTLEVPCFRKDAAVCTAKCSQVLKCGHTCEGRCHDCHEGRLHIPCRKNCKRVLVCGHECGDRCSNCPPCTEKCQNRCSHSKCFKTCGEICVSCQEPCQWKCAHSKCTKKCSQPCNRPPCDEPCTKFLRCEHRCIGLCGEPCPRLCRVCDKDEVTTILFGTEDEPDARFVELEDCGHIVEVSALDHYMEMERDSEGIQLKACPKCKTQIRRNVRYGYLIKGMLKDIETVKIKHIGQDYRITELKNRLQNEVEFELDPEEMEERQNILTHGYVHTELGLTAIQNQFRFLKKISKVFDAYEKLGNQSKLTSLSSVMADVLTHMKELERFREWIQIARFSLSDQEESDAKNELLRHQTVVKLIRMEKTIALNELKFDENLTSDLRKLNGMLKYGKPYTEERQARAKAVLQTLKKHVPESGLNISEDEKVDILKAMGMQKGHWFKCPNGHVYAIGDCGGATEEAKCPECKATIGGASHTLRADNALATEMDGARQSAWPGQANMQDYNLDDLLLNL